MYVLLSYLYILYLEIYSSEIKGLWLIKLGTTYYKWNPPKLTKSLYHEVPHHDCATNVHINNLLTFKQALNDRVKMILLDRSYFLCSWS